MNLPNFSFGKVSILAGGICLALLFSISAFAQNATKDDFTLLDESEYRGEIETASVRTYSSTPETTRVRAGE